MKNISVNFKTIEVSSANILKASTGQPLLFVQGSSYDIRSDKHTAEQFSGLYEKEDQIRMPKQHEKVITCNVEIIEDDGTQIKVDAINKVIFMEDLVQFLKNYNQK